MLGSLNMYPSIRVRLTVNLTEYHPALRTGVEGVTVGQAGTWSRGSDRFVGVRFPGAGIHDILWSSLEIIDEEYLRERAAAKEREREALKTATNAVLHLGPKGGFRALSYEYEEDGVTRHIAQGVRESADEVLALFREYGIPVREVRAEAARR
jgi:hypothetical protein